MNVKAPKFDWTFNAGHVLTALTVAISVGGGFWGVSWSMAKAFAAVEYRFSAAEKRLTDTEARAATWIPRLEAGERGDNTRDNRIENLADAVKQIRQQQADEFKQLRADLSDLNRSAAGTREVMARLSALIENKQRN